MIPKGGSAFLAPLFGNWAGKDDMTKYFFKDTPLAGLEQQMMTQPNFTPRGGGQMILCRFRYRPDDVDCKNCTEYRKKVTPCGYVPGWKNGRKPAWSHMLFWHPNSISTGWTGCSEIGFERYSQEKRRSPTTTRVTLPAYRSIPHTWPAIGNVMTEIVVWLLCI